VPHDISTLQTVAQLLRSIGSRTEEVGAQLCADPHLAGKHLTLLQEIDALSQRQMALASLLEASDLGSSLQSCSLEWVQQAFHAG
jgi:hypothetical protein